MPVVPYVRQTWADGVGGGTPVSAARLNVIEAGVNDVSYAPAVRAFHNANQSIANNTATALALNSERIDQAGNAADTMHDNVTNNSRLTCRYAGVYMIEGGIEWAGAPGLSFVQIRLNGVTVLRRQGVGAGGIDLRYVSVATEYPLAVNDYVELVVLQVSGAALNVSALGNYSPEFAMVRVA